MPQCQRCEQLCKLEETVSHSWHDRPTICMYTCISCCEKTCGACGKTDLYGFTTAQLKKYTHGDGICFSCEDESILTCILPPERHGDHVMCDASNDAHTPGVRCFCEYGGICRPVNPCEYALRTRKLRRCAAAVHVCLFWQRETNLHQYAPGMPGFHRAEAEFVQLAGRV